MSPGHSAMFLGPLPRGELGWGLGAEPETIEKKPSRPGGSQSDPGGPGGRWERLALAASGCDRAWAVPCFYLPVSQRGEDPAPSLPRDPPHGKVGKSPWLREMLDAQGPIAETAARLFAEAFMLETALRCLAPVYPEHDASASTSADLLFLSLFRAPLLIFATAVLTGWRPVRPTEAQNLFSSSL